MAINEHAQTFAGCPVIQWEPGQPIKDPAGAVREIFSVGLLGVIRS